uniref:Uncharacterized protein n=1 Tax=Nymphaea colorata TaxID=210225 RepID=A0A5K1BEQ6_9MAGN
MFYAEYLLIPLVR